MLRWSFLNWYSPAWGVFLPRSALPNNAGTVESAWAVGYRTTVRFHDGVMLSAERSSFLAATVIRSVPVVDMVSPPLQNGWDERLTRAATKIRWPGDRDGLGRVPAPAKTAARLSGAATIRWLAVDRLGGRAAQRTGSRVKLTGPNCSRMDRRRTGRPCPCQHERREPRPPKHLKICHLRPAYLFLRP